MNRTRQGAAAEMLVCADLMRKGYEVYRALNAGAPFDLISYKDNELLKIEVRSTADNREFLVRIRPNDDCDLYAFVINDKITYKTPSEAVRDYRKRKKPTNANCDVCGCEFTTTSKEKTCSNKCRKIRSRRYNTKYQRRRRAEIRSKSG